MNIGKMVIIGMVVMLLSACAGSPPEPKQPSGSKVPVNPVGISILDLER